MELPLHKKETVPFVKQEIGKSYLLLKDGYHELITEKECNFIVTYKAAPYYKELFWETTAKTDIEAISLFHKTHDCNTHEIISVNKD